MLFAVFIVQSDILLQTFGHVFVVNDDLSLGSIAENIDNVQQLAGVSSAETEQRPGLFDPHAPLPEHRVGSDGAIQQSLQIAVLHRLQHIDLTTRQQRRDHFERRIFGRRADQRNHALLDGAEQRILLRLVETVDFVDKQERRRRIEEMTLAGLLDHFAHLFHAGIDRRQREKLPVESRRHQPRQRRLADSRRSPQDKRRHVARLQKAAEHPAAADQMGLSDVVVERLRTQPFRQWYICLHKEKMLSLQR